MLITVMTLCICQVVDCWSFQPLLSMRFRYPVRHPWRLSSHQDKVDLEARSKKQEDARSKSDNPELFHVFILALTWKSSIHLRHSHFWWCSRVEAEPVSRHLLFVWSFLGRGRLVGKKCPALAIGKHVLIVSKTKLLIINCHTKETREVDDSRWCLCASDGPKIYLADKDALLALSSRTSIWMTDRQDATIILITVYVAGYQLLKYVWLCSRSRSDN